MLRAVDRCFKRKLESLTLAQDARCVSLFTLITFIRSVPERLKGADCKSAGNSYAGSNPVRPTILYILLALSPKVVSSIGRAWVS